LEKKEMTTIIISLVILALVVTIGILLRVRYVYRESRRNLFAAHLSLLLSQNFPEYDLDPSPGRITIRDVPTSYSTGEYILHLEVEHNLSVSVKRNQHELCYTTEVDKALEGSNRFDLVIAGIRMMLTENGAKTSKGIQCKAVPFPPTQETPSAVNLPTGDGEKTIPVTLNP
jgi:hypothetical protein